MAERVTEKYCVKCRKVLPIAKFYTYRSMACGRPTRRYTKLCRRHWDVHCNWVRRHKPNKGHAPKQLSDAERKLRQSARHMLGNAVYMRRIKKPVRCEKCGKRVKKVDLHGHHEDYRKAYKVHWYCRICHLKESA